MVNVTGADSVDCENTHCRPSSPQGALLNIFLHSFLHPKFRWRHHSSRAANCLQRIWWRQQYVSRYKCGAAYSNSTLGLVELLPWGGGVMGDSSSVTNVRRSLGLMGGWQLYTQTEWRGLKKAMTKGNTRTLANKLLLSWWVEICCGLL